MTDRDDRIRELAYFMWREEGCREGHDERHWLAAEILLESEDLDRKRIEPIGDARRFRSVKLRPSPAVQVRLRGSFDGAPILKKNRRRPRRGSASPASTVRP